MRNSFILITLSLAFCTVLYSEAAEAKKTVEIILQASSEDDGFEAYRAMDGDVHSMWHTQWRGTVAPLPHTLTADLTGEYEIKGLVLTPRAEEWNGVIRRWELFVSNDAQQPGEPVYRGELPRERTPQTVLLDKPVQGRYFTVKVLSEYGAGPYASLAELELLCDTAVFKAKKMTSLQMQLAELGEELGSGVNPERLDEFLRLVRDIKQKARFDRIA